MNEGMIGKGINKRMWFIEMHPKIDPSIGFRIQFFCQRCKLILSPNKLVEGCPKCQENIDLLLV